MDNPQGENAPTGEVSSQQPFYNEFSQISDPKVAEDIAYVEKNEGRDAAIAREDALQKEQDTGLTERERKNFEIVNMLVEEFPDAFVKDIDKNGTEILSTGVSVVQYDEVLSKLPVSTPKRSELSGDYARIFNELRMTRLLNGKKILQALIDTSESVYISRYGIFRYGTSFGPVEGSDIDNDSIRIFSEDELKVFFKILKFLDKVGKARKEIAMEEERKNRSVEDFRNLAQQIKNTPNS